MMSSLWLSQRAAQNRRTTPAEAVAHGLSPCGVVGLSTEASGLANAAALQAAIDARDTVAVTCAGTFDVASTVYLRSNTHLRFAAGARLRKVRPPTTTAHAPFVHVLLNRGAVARRTDYNITIEGLHIVVNGVDEPNSRAPIVGLRGHVALFHVRNATLRGLRILDLGVQQFGLHVCSFEGLLVEDAAIAGRKDGVHLGNGRGFVVRRYVAQTFDDALGLIAYDYVTSNPELGWLEDGVVEGVDDREQPRGSPHAIGAFARLVGGAWLDWRPGMPLQMSDTVVHRGGVYRVLRAPPKGRAAFVSTSPPSDAVDAAGGGVGTTGVGRDGVPWLLAQRGRLYSVGVRNVTFRNCRLAAARQGVWLKFDDNRFSRSIYPGAPLPTLGPVRLRNVRHASPRRSRHATIVAAAPHANVSARGGACRLAPNVSLALATFCAAGPEGATAQWAHVVQGETRFSGGGGALSSRLLRMRRGGRKKKRKGTQKLNNYKRHGWKVESVPVVATAGSSYPTDAADLAAADASAIPPARKPSAEREAAAADRVLLNEQVNELKLLRGDVRQIVSLMKRWERWGPGP